MRLQALRAQAAQLTAEMMAISEAAKDRAYTEDEGKQFDALEAKHKDLVASIEREERLEAARRAGQQQTAAGTDPDQAAANASAKAAGVRVEVGKDNVDDDPKRGFKDHRDFMSAVMHAGRNPMRVDGRLRRLQAAQGSDEQGAYSDPHGGFFIPHAIAPGILTIQPEDDPLLPLVTPVTMTAPTVTFNARVDKDHSASVSGGFVVTRRPETVDGTPSRAKFEQITLTANEEFGLAVATERILTDSPTSFVAIIQAGFRDEYAANGMNERINGLGVGERQGYLKTDCRIAVPKESGQTARTILKENIDKMVSRCWRYSRAIWIANHNTRVQLKTLVFPIGTAGESAKYLTGQTGGAEFLDNRPIFFSEYAKTLGTEGDLALIVPSEYLEGTYQTEQYAESMHVRFAAAERMFRFYRRNDGQWWWKTALTPKNGDTLSPVVTLATRA
jgi:HK97 family phage major capsid protein